MTITYLSKMKVCTFFDKAGGVFSDFRTGYVTCDCLEMETNCPGLL